MIADTVQFISSKWWTFLLRGIIALALAIWAFSNPTGLAAGLVYIVAAYFIIVGLLEFFSGLSLTGVGSWWALILLGVVQVLLGIIMLTRPGAGTLALAFLIAIWMFATGLIEISSAIALRNYISGEFWWIILGLITLAFGVYIVLQPAIGLLALVYAIGIYAVIAGVALILAAFRIRNLPQQLDKAVTTVKQSVENVQR